MPTDYSPGALALFLAARDVAAAAQIAPPLTVPPGVTPQALGHARAGRLKRAATRAALWGALGLVPAETGARLTDDGGQDNGATAPQGRPPVAAFAADSAKGGAET